MRTKSPLAFAFTHSGLRAELLSLFFLNPKNSYYLRGLERRLKVSPGALARELKILSAEGLLVREKGEAKVIFYRLNSRYPLYNEIKSVVEKFMGSVKGPALLEEGRTSIVYIVAGPNGSGKTTFAQKFLPDYVRCKQFVNADLIAGGLSPFSPAELALQAGKLLLEQIRTFAEKRVNFGFETTLAGKTYQRLFADLKAKGYFLQLFFLWIPSVEMAVMRIKDRVKRGGHHIPEPVVRRRFTRGIQNLFTLYRPLLDSWVIFDNAESFPHAGAAGNRTNLEILDEKLFHRIRKVAGVNIA